MAGVADSGETGELRADCARCFGLCCVALPFAVSADFAIDKPAGTPCPNLAADDRCRIHRQLRPRGFAGCSVYDCFGAGQHVSQVLFGARSWREDPAVAGQMFAVFAVVRQLHEMLWYLAQAAGYDAARPVRAALLRERAELQRLTNGDPEVLLSLDVAARRAAVGRVLAQASELVRGRPAGRDLRGAELIGAHLRGAELVAADLRAAILLGADLRAANLRRADLLGTDLRAADLRGADLSDALFLTQSQLDSATGDGSTTLTGTLHRPTHWPT